MRHFIFILPLIAVAAALVADHVLDWPVRSPYRRPIYLVVAVYGIAHVSIMVMLHPHQYIYYNAFVGGVKGAEGAFELDYWANSYAEAVKGLEDYLRTGYGPDFEHQKFSVFVCGPPESAYYFFPPNFRLTFEEDKADFVIAINSSLCESTLAAPSVSHVERMGARLSAVLDRRNIRTGF